MLPKNLRPVIALSLGLLAAGCVSSGHKGDKKAMQPIPAYLVETMKAKSMSPAQPILVRVFKQESELEIWKRDSSGRFALLKTYPMCRWSGQLGPKKMDGDRQAPEGFYHVTARMLNPRSNYHLAFNLGYPNKLESALGYTGDALMIHGACSSSGCYAMTDDGVSEIYAIGREALRGGQTMFQVQAYPFRMTPANMAKHSNNPNYAFWTNLKQGYDTFEVTRRQPVVSYCGGKYVFNAHFADGEPSDPLAACPTNTTPADPAVAARSQADKNAIDRLLVQGIKPNAHAYADGGMHPSFRKLLEKKGATSLARQTSRTSVPVSRPETLTPLTTIEE